MRRVSKLWFLVLLSAVLGLPSPAQAQQFRTFRGGFSNGFGRIRFGTFGPLGFGYPGFGYPGFGYPGIYGLAPGFASPFGGSPFMSSSYFNPGANYASPYAYNSFQPEPYLMPGFAASEPVRSRPTLYPAIVEPSREVIAAALYGDEKDRARIAIRVPSVTASVYLDGVLTKQTGLDRMFVTPMLKTGSRYFFDVEVVWQSAEGQSRRLKRRINLRAGDDAKLDLSQPD